MTDHATAWYALWVKPRHEKSVQRFLSAEQYRSFTPLFTARHRWADRFRDVELPLFPGYVFCRFDQTLRYPVLRIPGVIDIVRGGSHPAAIPDSEIEALEYVMSTDVDREPWLGLVAGDSAVIVCGPLAGLAGVVIEYKGKLRLVLAVTLLQRSVLVEVDRSSLIPTRRGAVVESPEGSRRIVLATPKLSRTPLAVP